MREHISRIHHHVFMDEESVPEHMVLKVVQVRRARIQILKMRRCNARTHFSFHHHVFMDEESVSEYML